MNKHEHESPQPAERPLTRARPTWDGELLLVCRKCQKGLRRGVDGRGTWLSDWLPGALKRAGARKAFYVVECGCLDLCPKRGVTLMRAGEAGSAKPLRVYREGEDPQQVVDWLLDKPADA